MGITTSQQLQNYFEQFQNAQVTFTRETTKATLLNTKQVFLKCAGSQWPCILYSSSMTSAKVIANVDDSLKGALQKVGNSVQLRYSFLRPEKGIPLSFFVGARVTGFSPYRPENPQLNFLNVEFTQHPPDDLIEILGKLQEAFLNASRRAEYRVLINPDTTKKLGLLPKETGVVVERIPRRCILRDISFSGAKIVIHGVPQFLQNKAAVLRLKFEDPPESIDLMGKIVRFEVIEGRTDISAIAIKFNDDTVPTSYKMRVNSFVRTIRDTTKQQSDDSPESAE